MTIYLGYRIRPWSALPRLLRVGRGLAALRAAPPDGLLSPQDLSFGFLHPGFRQHWRDPASLEAFTRADPHAGWWRDVTRNGGGGIWHEAYHRAGGFEAIYAGVPGIGFAAFAPALDLTGVGSTARTRLG